jgi:hypothetical protein
MRIRLPRGRVLEGPILAQFDRERERIETIMSRKTTAGVAVPGKVATASGN